METAQPLAPKPIRKSRNAPTSHPVTAQDFEDIDTLTVSVAKAIEVLITRMHEQGHTDDEDALITLHRVIPVIQKVGDEIYDAGQEL